VQDRASDPQGDVHGQLTLARGYLEAGQPEVAERLCRETLTRAPGHSGGLHLLAVIAYQGGNLTVALAFATKALAGSSADPDILRTLGDIQVARGELEAAAEAYTRALGRKQDSAGLHKSLGNTLMTLSRPAEAEGCFRRALAIKPASAGLHNNLGWALLAQGRPSEAERSFRRALSIEPSHPIALNNHGVALLAQGQVEEAILALRQACAAHPNDAGTHSNLLMTLHYSAEVTRQVLLEEARAWATRHEHPHRDAVQAHANRPDPGRRLRIGYVSADLRVHPVGRLIQAVIASHARDEVEVFCYSNHWRPDARTLRIREAADHWRNISGMDDATAVERIRADAVDILVDLGGHTGYNRLPLFARKPAPVQASWLGYFGTTGMSSMDYLVADPVVCPPDAEQWYVERVVRLPGDFLCYTPPEDAPEPACPAADAGDGLTFGCFNNLSKVGPRVISAWARIARAVPRSRFLLMSNALADPAVQRRYTDLFGQHGVDSDRIVFRGVVPFQEYLAAYADVDVALDPFPYNGGMTTLDALWMGVPVVSLRGDRFVARMGASHLTSAGLSALVADSEDEYVQVAAALAGDRARRAELRSTLRERLAASPLCDPERLTRGLEDAYRQMWRAWCAMADRDNLTAQVGR
jgi:predicted O-linked N-acetylglucosamine transferase (SPINDLY family)